ncbi:aldo/keto reductase [Rickettsiales bacterium]|nr:aldo/keto reductase [Rickettsiales bacterium]
MKFGIGTVQFGLDYGLSNNIKIPSNKQIKEILLFFKENNLEYIDTASLYGLSEEKIGKLSPVNNRFKIITKTIKVTGTEVLKNDIINLKENIKKSFENLKRKTIYSILIHRETDLLKPGSEEIYNYLSDLKKKKMIKKIGFSSYSPETANSINKKFNFDIIQLPINILNQKYLKNNFLEKLKKKKIEIHVRSIFDQGILAENEDALDIDIDLHKKKKIKSILNYLKKKKCSLIKAAILFVKRINQVDVLIFGIHNLSQLKETYEIFKYKDNLDINFKDISL